MLNLKLITCRKLQVWIDFINISSEPQGWVVFNFFINFGEQLGRCQVYYTLWRDWAR